MSLHKENLEDGRYVYTSADHTFGNDALLLARFAEVRESDRVCDLGTGCGVIPLLLHSRAADAVEISPAAVALARRSVAECGLNDCIMVHEADWRELSLPAGAYDRVLCNPPYFAEGSGAASLSPERRRARHEQGDTLGDVTRAAARLLRVGGHFVLCHRPERLADVVSTLRAYRLEPKRLQLVQTRADLPPFLLLCDAVRDGKPSLAVLPPLILESR